MRILLVNPKWIQYPGTSGRLGGPPSNLAVVAAAFGDGVDISIFDYMADDNNDEKFIQRIMEFDPDAIGFSSTWTVQHCEVERLAVMCRKLCHGVKLFVGGHHVSVCGIAQPLMDVTVVGEIENCVMDVYYALGNDYADDTPVVIHGKPADNLDFLPLPAYELLDLDYYRKAQRNHHGSLLLGGMPVTTSRGCPHKCNFCTIHLTMGRKWRANSPSYIMEHLQKLYDLGFSNIHFEDDNLLLDKMRWIEVMRKMAKWGRWNWDTPNGVRLDALDDDMIRLAKASGCKELRVSIESGSDRVRNELIHKRLSIQNVMLVAEKCLAAGIRFSAFYTVGIPGETVEEMRSTLKLAARLEDDWNIIPRFSIATPFPGTELLQDCIDNDWLNVPYPYTNEQLAGGTHLRGLITTPEFTPEDISQAYSDWKARTL